MKCFVLFVLVFLLSCQFARGRDAELEDAILACAARAETAERMKCYEVLAESLRKVREKMAAEGFSEKGNWLTAKQLDRINDSETFIAFIQANESLKTSAGEKRPNLYLRCAGNVTDAFVAWERPIEAEDSIEVEYRVDTAKPVKEMWLGGKKGQSTFAPHPVAFAKRLKGSKSLAVSIKPKGEAKIVVNFDLAGVDNVISELRNACRWQ